MSFAARIEPLSYAVRSRVVLKYLGELSRVLAVLTLVPAGVAGCAGETGFALHSALVVLGLTLVGIPLARLSAPAQIQLNEALVIVALAFLLASLVMSLPMTGEGLPPIDAVFQAISALTTTGLSTVASVADQSTGFLFARAWMQWYGGLGFVVFSIALMLMEPGVAARRLAETESEEEDLVGGTRAHARRLLAVYLSLTLLGIVILWSLGLPFFSALVHTLSAVSTGGFSLYDESLAGLGRWPVQAAVMLVATTGAISLPLYYRAIRPHHWRELFANLELRALLLASLLGIGILALCMGFAGSWSWGEVLLHAPLMGLSAQTGTGFSSLSVSSLDNTAKLVLLIPMAIGGSTGSTTGGIKLLRLLILLRLLQRLILRTRLPRHAVVAPWLGHERLEAEEIERVLLLILIFILVVVFSWIPFLAFGHEPLDALFDVVSATATVGLSTGVTGPDLEPFLKGVLCLDMLLGRVEFIALLVVLYPGTWFGRRNV